MPRYRRICFNKDAVAGQPQAVLVAPGHPLLDSLIDLTLERYRELLIRGTVLINESDRHENTRVLFVLRQAIRDGRKSRHGKPLLVSERLQFVWIDENGQTSDAGPAPHLDCRGPNDEERERLAEIMEADWLKGALEEQAREISITELVPRHLQEVKSRRLDELDKIESAVKVRMRREITHLHHRALEIEAEERAGKKPRLNSQNLRRQAEKLTGRLETRLAEVARQRDIAPLPPEICGAALVVPASLMKPRDSTLDHVGDKPDALTRKQIEEEAMAAVMARESESGFEPRDISAENRGYDIESRDPATGKLRFIEVKGRRADAREITITRNEMLMALNASEHYILAALLVDDGYVHDPMYVNNPAELFGAEPRFNEVHRSITVESIKRAVDAGSRT